MDSAVRLWLRTTGSTMDSTTRLQDRHGQSHGQLCEIVVEDHGQHHAQHQDVAVGDHGQRMRLWLRATDRTMDSTVNAHFSRAQTSRQPRGTLPYLVLRDVVLVTALLSRLLWERLRLKGSAFYRQSSCHVKGEELIQGSRLTTAHGRMEWKQRESLLVIAQSGPGRVPPGRTTTSVGMLELAAHTALSEDSGS